MHQLKSSKPAPNLAPKPSVLLEITELKQRAALISNFAFLLYDVTPTLTYCACVLSRFSHIRLHATLWTVAGHAPLFKRFSRQEYWSELPCSPPGDLSNPETEPGSLTSPTLAGRFLTTSSPWEALEWFLKCLSLCAFSLLPIFIENLLNIEHCR